MSSDLQERAKDSKRLKNEVPRSEHKIVARTPRKASLDDYRDLQRHEQTLARTRMKETDKMNGKERAANY
jgi:hypothetical protein